MGTIVVAPHNTKGNGGRKEVKLANGWLIAAVYNSYFVTVHKSMDDGDTWSEVGTRSHQPNRVQDVAMVSKGNNVYLLSSVKRAEYYYIMENMLTEQNIRDSVMPSGGSIDSSYTAKADAGGVSLVVDPSGAEIHGAWSVVGAAYKNGFNIRYAKGTFNGDGTVTWGAVVPVTNANLALGGLDITDPSIVVRDGAPFIFVAHNYQKVSNHIFVASTQITTNEGSTNYAYTGFGSKIVHLNAGHIQSASSAIFVPPEINGLTQGRFWVTWHGRHAGSATNPDIFVSYSDNGVNWATPKLFDNPSSYAQIYPSITCDKNNKIAIIFNGTTDNGVQVRAVFHTNNAWSDIVDIAPQESRNPVTLFDPTFQGVMGEVPPTVYMDVTGGAVNHIGTFTTNKAPTLTLNTINNATLYENDTFKIDGSAVDSDIGDIVNVWYRINSGTARAIQTRISDGSPIEYSEQLTFKGGKLHIPNGAALTGALAEGVAHKLKVWAQDNQGGQSVIAERSFYVVPNRAPTLTVNPFDAQSDLINNDVLTLSGVSSDPDGNDVTVKYRLNNGLNTEIHSGVAGPWTFDLSFKDLNDGENTIVVEVTDTYNSKSSRTIKLNKYANLTPLAASVQRYKIVPPSGSAQGVLLWIQRDVGQEVTAEISMTTGTEQEQFAPLTFDSAGPSGDFIEEFYTFRADAPAEHIALKFSWTGDKPIIMITGALTQ